ncbi:type I polyketide synthase [Anabaena cylindrica FACHB-243]|uniref:PfaB family protein n=1 Tax=Anabaena TaxID=1163 RepID=UPI000B5E6300|nr:MULTISPECIES: type I polyketide synthase [Anabaena]BAY04534.1 PfaB family protein [Anabaena cylindrica PCC 7122]MBD2417308.1 type I polyketide synthase [Anabaena cylindrica FACHB-243]MBY5281429.1 type I polyketide synthase [Anabaena sp. CCAP 1446/1C]MBY5310180.1 type I polyketide synthase [Anabaena sp. CCAP 1446/1C]MCM2410129.1 type I polyketide synthase [Anabaena sp. CCAP 1446/1C]
MKEFPKNKIPKIAIIGMDCFISNCQGLDAFESSIYQGKQHFTPLNYSDTPSLTIPLAEINQLSSQQQLMLQVANNALKNAQLNPETKIAVVMVTESQSHYQNKLASYISRLWDATSPAFAEENSGFSALNLAQKLLINKQVDAVLVAAMDFAEEKNQIIGLQTLSYDQNADATLVGEGAAAVVLQLHQTAKENNNCIYAVIDALSVVQNSPHQPQAVTEACQTAFQIADIQAQDIGYLEVYAGGNTQQDEAEIQGLVTAYTTGESNLSCAVGSIKANIGHTHSASGIISLIKTALCLYHRYIPAVPNWSCPKQPDMWSGSPFYVATESKPWFIEPGTTKRIAAVNSMEANGSYAHLILSEEVSQIERKSRYLEQIPYYLYAIAAENRTSLLNQITALKQTLKDTPVLSQLASQTFREFQKHQQSNYANYAIAILARNQEELTRELDRAIPGVNLAFDTGKDWQTPLGSYFTAKPQGKKGKVAFVYPGSFTSYIGVGRNLLRLFPKIYDDPIINSVYNRTANIEKILYPRSLKKLSKREIEALEQQLINDPVAMLESEVGFAGLMTAILRNYFQIQSQCVFGYSLGETSMMLAQGIWTSFKETSDYLNSSPLFKTQLSGPKNAVRQHWKIPGEDQNPDFWSNYILMCPLSRVQEAIKNEPRVYIPLINAPEEIVIAGETKACQRIIQQLNCDAFPTSINHVIHCEPMHSEYNELVKINTLPLGNVSESIFYSSAEYEPIKLNSHTIGHNIAKCLCQQLDFPRLINRVYNDNIRIFIEVGVGSSCSRWISSNLQEREHIAVSINRKGLDDHTSIIRALGKLLSHRVELDLSPLYSLSSEPNQPLINLENSTIKKPEKTFKSISGKPSNWHYRKLSTNNALMTKNHTFLIKSRQESLQQINSLIQQQIEFYKKILEQEPK